MTETTARLAPDATAPAGEGGCPGTTARSQPSGCRWTSGGRSRWTACRTTLCSSLPQDDGFGVLAPRRALPGTVVPGRERPGDLPRARRKTGKDAGPTVGDARVRGRHPDDRRAPLSRPVRRIHHICAGRSWSRSRGAGHVEQHVTRSCQTSALPKSDTVFAGGQGPAVTALRQKSITAMVSPQWRRHGVPP